MATKAITGAAVEKVLRAAVAASYAARTPGTAEGIEAVGAWVPVPGYEGLTIRVYVFWPKRRPPTMAHGLRNYNLNYCGARIETESTSHLRHLANRLAAVHAVVAGVAALAA